MDMFLGKPITDKVSQDMDNGWLSCGVSSMQGWRNSQEDSHNCLLDFDKSVALFAVYDGHGGAEVAQYAAEKLPSLVKNSLYDNQNYEKALIKAFMDFDDSLIETPTIKKLIALQEENNEDCADEEFINAKVSNTPKDEEKDEIEIPISKSSEAEFCSMDKKFEDNTVNNEESDADSDEEESSNYSFEYEHEPGKDSGCTAVMALIINGKLYVANAGDSRCVVSIGGEAHDLSKDHKPEDEPELHRIYKAGGWVSTDGRVNEELNLSRALGDHNYKKNKDLPSTEQLIIALPDVTVLDITPDYNNFIVLACDGIWNSLSSQKVVDFILERVNKPDVKLSSICEELFETCLAPDVLDDGVGCDNMTCIIIKLK